MKCIKYLMPVVVVTAILSMLSCRKYLDKKPDNELITPESVSDLLGLLDRPSMNVFSYPAEILCDDYYLSPADWALLVNNQNETVVTHKNLHIWQADDNTDPFWSGIYQNIFIANIVLDELPGIDFRPGEKESYNNVKGSALFLRAFYFYHLAQSFSKPYIASTRTTDPGIVLRLSSDVNDASVRASVKDTYDQVVKDFKSSITLLPIKPIIKTRPSQPAAYGALARTYLVMHEYDSARKYADLCLLQYDSLIDYNSLNASSNIPFAKYTNKEVIFSARTVTISSTLGARSKIDSNLYKSYSDTDTRKQLFFRASSSGGFLFKGDYDSVGAPPANNNTFFSFIGIVTDEMYLIKAECCARNNDLTTSMIALNKMLETRYKTGLFVPVTANTKNEAMMHILEERRKELLHRGSRWSDIKRLMSEDEYRIVPTRTINNQVTPMTNNNTVYLMQLPKLVIALTGIPQN